MAKVIVDVNLTPIGTGTASLSRYVAAAENALKHFPDIQSRLNPMTTTLEGDLDRVLLAVQEMHEAAFREGALRVSTTMRIDDRRDGAAHSMEERIQSVQAKQ